ncbi:lipase ZK262.3-like isoform X2 [Dendronephthya gigantea]|uniref:lipase ZK262.3-like isoform X2 n=1 Tax=Dendronephthya gigantea TaxID=151771 RepID=UPI00106C5710|nr:lipase ZK262.3-like isoform X2 [Dendronephthya gigantea]
MSGMDMTNKNMFLLFIVFVFLSFDYSNALLFGSDCQDENDCISCTKHKTWSGENCRWCPRDKECHAQGSLLNKCSRTENIVKPADCDKIIYAKYDKDLAYKMIYLSALAYADDVAKYIPKASDVNTFQLVKQVTKPCSGGAMCSGFVAVSHSEKAIAVAFRGTQHIKQLVNEILRILTEPKQSFQPGGKVQVYFLDAFQIVWNDLQNFVYEEIEKYPNYKVWVTGHSLGATLASLASTLIASEQKTTKDNLILYTFGQPRVGNYDYALAHDGLVPLSFRVTHFRDIVVHLPTCKVVVPGTPCVALGGGPYHHGKEIFYGSEIMTKSSSYKVCEGLPHNEDLGCSNNPLVWSKCFSSQLPKCIDDHKQYFSINIGTWWKNHTHHEEPSSNANSPIRHLDLYHMIGQIILGLLYEMQISR